MSRSKVWICGRAGKRLQRSASISRWIAHSFCPFTKSPRARLTRSPRLRASGPAVTCQQILRRSSLPSRSSAWKWLLKKEWRELLNSRPWWVMLALIGPLVGVSFISAVRSYAEASGQGGTGAGLADALFPLDGVVAPTFSAYEIAASFLLPFVAIRAVAGDRVSGALKLELQQGMAPLSMIGTKALVLVAG